ncbi:hypothetical protein ABG067_004915 [Albugo candida]
MEFESKSLLWQVSRSNDQVIGTRIHTTKSAEKSILISSKNEIVEFSLPQVKHLNHWVLRPAIQIKIGAVKNTNSQTYFAPIQLEKNQTIASWKESETDASKWNNVDLQCSTQIFDIFVHPLLREGCIAVMEDASIYFVTECPLRTIRLHENKDKSCKCTVSWAEMADTNRKSGSGPSTFLFILTRNTETLIYEMNVFLLSPSPKGTLEGPRMSYLAKRELHQNESARNARDFTVTSCAFHDEMIANSIVWSNGDWELLQWHYDSLNMELRDIGKRNMPHLAAMETKPGLGSSKKRKHESENLNRYQYVVSSIGLGGYLLFANTASLTTITSWNVRYGAQVACTPADWSDLIAQNCNRNLGRLHGLLSPPIGDLVIAEFDNGVGMLTIRTTQPTLASVLGCGALKEREGQYKLQADKISTMESPSASHSADFLAKDWKQCPFEMLIHAGRVCLKQPDQNTWCALQRIVESNRLTSGTIPSLMSTLMRKQQFSALDKAINNLVDIDERCLIRILQYVLKNRSNSALQAYVITQYRHQNSAAQQDDGLSNMGRFDMLCEYFIASVMKRPVNDVFLHAAIQLLNVDEALALLALCQRFLLINTSHARADQTNDAYLQWFMKWCPPPAVVLHWISVLLDTHYSAVVLLGGENLKKIQQDFETLARILELESSRILEEERLKVILESVVASGRSRCSTTRMVADYSIEQVEF